MSRGQRQREFAVETVFLSAAGRVQAKQEMKQRGASLVGCWARVPLLWLAAMAGGLACLVVCVAQSMAATVTTSVDRIREWVFVEWGMKPAYVIGG
jgi:hypothetical protein